jgi:hypothetical protein
VEEQQRNHRRCLVWAMAAVSGMDCGREVLFFFFFAERVTGMNCGRVVLFSFFFFFFYVFAERVKKELDPVF